MTKDREIVTGVYADGGHFGKIKMSLTFCRQDDQWCIYWLKAIGGPGYGLPIPDFEDLKAILREHTRIELETHGRSHVNTGIGSVMLLFREQPTLEELTSMLKEVIEVTIKNVENNVVIA
jgi:hypothetical protein